MATASDFVKVAASQIGTKEQPANSNLTKYGKVRAGRQPMVRYVRFLVR